MRLASFSLLFLVVIASAAVAQMTPGVVVRSGEAFPIVADFNGDGLDDLIQERNVIINDGFSLSDVRDLRLPAGEKVFAVLDANGDGIPDLLTVGTAAAMPPSIAPNPLPGVPVYKLYLGNAARTYANGVVVASAPQLYVADVDGDGKDDLLIMTPVRPDGHVETATDVTVVRSKGDGTFERGAPFRIAPASQIVPDYRIQTADINHDGLPDLIIRCAEDLVILRGTGGGTFAVDDYYVPENMEFGWWSTRVGDVDGDSNPDVVIVGWRSIRVFFGDGHGGLSRMVTAGIVKLHDGSWTWTPVNPDTLNQPRDIALGHFTRTDQMQIAAGTSEGDIVVFSYENGALKEVSRTSTEFWAVDIRSGHFRNTRDTDLYAMGTLIWGDQYPKPRLFYGDASATPIAHGPSARTRSRASRPVGAPNAFQLQMKGDCIDDTAARFTLVRSGVFAAGQNGESRIQAIVDPPVIHFRLTAPYAQQPVEGIISESGGVYSGAASVMTSCGWKSITVTATAQ